MLLIIRGPQGSGKTTIARAIQHSTGATIYDEMPAEKPADFPSEGVVIITTQSAPYPDWVQYNAFYELITPRRASIKKTVEFWRSKWDGEKKAAVPSAMSPTTTAKFYVQLPTECPSCGECFDLLSILQEKGDAPIPVETQDAHIYVECPECTIEFIVNRITY